MLEKKRIDDHISLFSWQDEVEKIFQIFHKVVTGEAEAMDHLDELGKLAAFAGVAEFPVRVKCATLAWHAMHSALTNEDAEISTYYRRADGPSLYFEKS